MVYAHHGQLLKVRDVADRLQLGKTKIFELLATGQIESVKIDGARRISERAVDEYIARLESGARASA